MLGNRSDDGATVRAEMIYAGTFRQIAAQINSIDPATGEMKVTDLATKKPLIVRRHPRFDHEEIAGDDGAGAGQALPGRTGQARAFGEPAEGATSGRCSIGCRPSSSPT